MTTVSPPAGVSSNSSSPVTTNCNTEDWQNDLSVVDSNRFMLDNQVDCDVRFTLLPAGGAGGDETQIGCHRFVLVSRSPVFFAMFSGPMSECSSHKQRQQQQQQQQQHSDIRITDITATTFWQLLRYLYCEELELTEETVFAVLYAAKKYLVTSLARRCVSYLESVLSPENVCIFIENSFLFEDEYPGLRQRCIQVVERQSKRVFHSDAFFEISKETLCRVLRAERLSVHEIDVFRACLHWSERRVSLLNLAPTATNRRQVLGDTLKLIHFPAMNIDEFTKIVVPAGVLSVDEENAIFRTLLGAATVTAPAASSAAGEHSTNNDADSSGAASGGNTSCLMPFPRSSRNFVETRCNFAYDGYTRHGPGSASTLYRVGAVGATPHRTGWSLTVYCDHCIKVQEIGFFGTMKGNVYVAQNGYRKLEVTSATPVNMFRFGDDLQLDAGLFTVGADAPFTSYGDYFLRANTPAASAAVPSSVTTDHDRANLIVREASAVGLLAYIVFVPTDEIYFIENYYSDDSGGEMLSSLAATE